MLLLEAYNFECEKQIGTTGFRTIKRMCDLFFSLLIGVVTSPIILATIVAIRMESQGKAFYCQKRVGLNNKEYTIRKLRSMYIDAEKNGAQWAEKDDPRVTKVGKFIRKTRIDELPQLWNVINGDMSLIGPRPEREVFIREFEKDIPNFRKRVLVKPGLSGLAQVNGGYDISPREKFDLDMEYINQFGLKMDVSIFFKTLKVVVFGDGAR